MILIADSGSTKTKWGYTNDGVTFVKTIETEGINPVLQPRDTIERILNEVDFNGVESVRFYGAGCAECANLGTLIDLLKRHAATEDVTVQSDIVGAAIALFGEKVGQGICPPDPIGIACILGTGSNSILWDGREIVKNIHAGGFILGDEGSGSVLGKWLISDFIKGLTPEWMTKILSEEYGLDYFTVIEHVHRQPMPNRWLAQFTKLLGAHRDTEYVHNLLVGEFCRFFERNVMRYEGYCELPVGFIGSIAFVFEDELREAAARYNINVAVIKRTPF